MLKTSADQHQHMLTACCKRTDLTNVTNVSVAVGRPMSVQCTLAFRETFQNTNDDF